MVVKRLILIFLAIMATAATDALAGPTLDQSNIGGGTARDEIHENRQLAQTFTVGIAGILDSIVLDLNYYDEVPTKDITVEIRSTTGGLPDGPEKAFASVNFDTSVLTTEFKLYSVDFTSFSLPFAVGDQLAIVLTSEDDAWHAASWRGAAGNPYPGGKWYLRTGTEWSTMKDYDAYFQTYVVPAPGALHLVVIGLASFVLKRRKLSKIARNLM